MRCFLLTAIALVTFMMFYPTAYGVETSDISQNIYESEATEELYQALDIDSLYSELPASSRESLKRMGIGDTKAKSISEVTLGSVMSEILLIAGEQSGVVLKSLSMVIAVLIIYSIVDGFSQSLTSITMREVLSVVCALCIACALVIPVTEIIDASGEAIRAASNFMLAYVPIMVAVLVSCGRSLSGSGYYSLMIMAAEGISQLSAKFITPLLNVFLGVSISGAIIPQVRLDGLTAMFSKSIKWLLSFTFTIFSALLTFKTLIATSIDSVSTRAVRYTMSSFIPVVGAALSEAYKTVQGSVNILKNGIGVFVIFAVAVVFLPIVIRLMLWIFSVGVCKAFAQMLNLTTPSNMLFGVSTVLSVLLAVILCIMALFIISTALIITAGGYGL